MAGELAVPSWLRLLWPKETSGLYRQQAQERNYTICVFGASGVSETSNAIHPVNDN